MIALGNTIQAYWIINPVRDKAGITELRLHEGKCVEARQVYGEEFFETDFPFPVKLVPHRLLAKDDWRKYIGGE